MTGQENSPSEAKGQSLSSPTCPRARARSLIVDNALSAAESALSDIRAALDLNELEHFSSSAHRKRHDAFVELTEYRANAWNELARNSDNKEEAALWRGRIDGAEFALNLVREQGGS